MLDSFPADRALLLIVLFPLVGAIALGLASRLGANRSAVRFVAVGSVFASFVTALFCFAKLYVMKDGDLGGEAVISRQLWEWFHVTVPGFGQTSVDVRFSMDSLSGLMTLVVTGIGGLIHLYALSYMEEEDDAGYARFFTYLNLFTASMLILVLASNLVVMFVGWEGVGLCSYLLIGYKYQYTKYAKAGKKAFIANRVGDLGVIIGMFTLLAATGSFEFAEINAAAPGLKNMGFTFGGETPFFSFATIACGFLFLGCTGKSAQIPLYVWLPDAMAGPTPVSALIHAATMVTSGIYLCCRLSPVFLQSTTVMATIAIIGSVTALVAATIAVVQKEMKKILAYSTVSQLGFMFAAVGVGAFTAGFFHVFTHAFFKACLFLGAGSVMHAIGSHTDANIFKLGGLRHKLKTTHWTFLVSCLAIAGTPFFSGFFSKDEILLGAASVALPHLTEGQTTEGLLLQPWTGWFVLITLFVAATMTAFYMFRMYFLAFWGEEYRSAHGGDHHDQEHGHTHNDGHHDDHHDNGGYEPAEHAYAAKPHESPVLMTFPLQVLGVGAVIVGFLGLPHLLPGGIHLPNLWGEWMSASIASIGDSFPALHASEEHMSPIYVAMTFGLLAWAIGVGAAYQAYANATIDEDLAAKNMDHITAKLGAPVHTFLFDKWRVDEAYDFAILKPIRGLAQLSANIDQSFVDTLLTRFTAWGARGVGWVFTRLQTGVVHFYGFVFILGAAALSWWFLYPHPSLEVRSQEGARVTVEAGTGLGYEYQFDMDSDGQPEGEFGSANTQSFAYDADDHVGFVMNIGTLRGDPEQIPLFRSEQQIDTDLLGVSWQRELAEGEDESALNVPPVVWVTQESKLAIRPNGALVRGGQLGDDGYMTFAPGDVARIGRVPVQFHPVVRATVEVRNAFGHTRKYSEEFVLDGGSRATARLQLTGAPQEVAR